MTNATETTNRTTIMATTPAPARKISARWHIFDAVHGYATIQPHTIRYYRNARHPYGWQVGFTCKIRRIDGSLADGNYGALGITRNAAMSNALPRR